MCQPQGHSMQARDRSFCDANSNGCTLCHPPKRFLPFLMISGSCQQNCPARTDVERSSHNAFPLKSYWSAINIGIRPLPLSRVLSAFPIIDPKAFAGSIAFIACPGVGDVVNRSPTSIGEYSASTLQ